MKSKLEERKEVLERWKKEKEKAVISAPEGCLRICNKGNKTHYYMRTDPKDYNGVYIKNKDFKIAQKLAQKDYDKKVLSHIEKELSAINKYLLYCPGIYAEEIYEHLNAERKQLIRPILQTEEDYVREWESIQFKGKDFDESAPKLYTAKGERVRSKSEVIIADALNREGIPYRYEYPVSLKQWGNVYPDFTVLNVRKRKEIYWEHLGMMGDAEYVDYALKKLNAYEENGIFAGDNLIVTYETKDIPVNQKTVNRMIERYLK